MKTKTEIFESLRDDLNSVETDIGLLSAHYLCIIDLLLDIRSLLQSMHDKQNKI